MRILDDMCEQVRLRGHELTAKSSVVSEGGDKIDSGASSVSECSDVTRAVDKSISMQGLSGVKPMVLHLTWTCDKRNLPDIIDARRYGHCIDWADVNER